jgi:hypothetical protein
LPGLSPVQGKAVVARFDGGRLSSEGGLLALREIETRLGLADRLAACVKDSRAPERVVQRLAEIIRFRMLMIAAGYEDGNDADSLPADAMFKLALDRLPSDEELCSQPTISRLENLPHRRALLRLGRALIEQYCTSFRQMRARCGRHECAAAQRRAAPLDDSPAIGAELGSSPHGQESHDFPGVRVSKQSSIQFAVLGAGEFAEVE